MVGALESTLQAYDGNGNMSSSKGPLLATTGTAYDALNRVIQVVDPAGGVTAYSYDNANNLLQVSDPLGHVTSYSYSGLNDPLKQVSPDTGTTTSTYDSAGNVLTQADSRGVVTAFTYDSLNRVKLAVHSRTGFPTETHNFTYDSGANGKGHLTPLVDSVGTTAWTYTQQGRVATKSQTVGTVTQTLSMIYNPAGQLTAVTTPSGQVLGYSYVNNRVVGITLNGAVLLGGATTEPFGPLNAWNWGNGLHTFRDYDLDGRIVTWEFRNGISVLRNDLAFDAADRLVSISDPANPVAKQIYQFDALDRLTQAQTGTVITRTQTFAYDANSNRLAVTTDGSATTLSYSGSGNQLQTLNGNVAVDYLAGHASLAFTYNNANRLISAADGSAVIATFGVNGLGQRISKVVGGTTTTLSVFDERGYRIGDYDGNGNMIEETVWLDDLPVATLRPTGTGNPTL